MFLSRKVMEVQMHSQELFDINLRRTTPWFGCSKWLEALCLQLWEQDRSALSMMFCHKTRLSTLLHWWKKRVLEERLKSWGCGVRKRPHIDLMWPWDLKLSVSVCCARKSCIMLFWLCALFCFLSSYDFPLNWVFLFCWCSSWRSFQHHQILIWVRRKREARTCLQQFLSDTSSV